MKLTPFQERLAEVWAKQPNGSASVSVLAGRLRSNNLAVHSAMRSLKKRGLAGSFPSDRSQWAVTYWFMKGELKERYR